VENDHPKIQEAKRQAISPSLGRMLGQFPILFARAVIFGKQRSQNQAGSIKNGTSTIVDFGTGPIAVTCAHVLAAYRGLRESGENVYFQVGNVRLEPDAQLIDENAEMDLATISLSVKQAEKLQSDGVPGSSIFHPTGWPSPPVKVGDTVALGGFPGSWREKVAIDELHFDSYSIGATAVSSVGQDRFACQFERDRWLWSSSKHSLEDVRDLGGLSGGPVFAIRGLHYDLVGIISEFSEAFDILFLKPAHLIAADGIIVAAV
jgi:hypothetical protein